MSLRITRHAAERYLQFHAIGSSLTVDEAQALLTERAVAAVRSGARTHQGDPVWRIESLGVEVVTRHADGCDIAVTVLPPPEYRGLTLLQVEDVHAKLVAKRAEVELLRAEYLANKRALRAARNADSIATAQSACGRVRSAMSVASSEALILQAAFKTLRVTVASVPADKIRRIADQLERYDALSRAIPGPRSDTEGPGAVTRRNMCECGRPSATPGDLARWREEPDAQHPERPGPTWARALCWTTRGTRCMLRHVSVGGEKDRLIARHETERPDSLLALEFVEAVRRILTEDRP